MKVMQEKASDDKDKIVVMYNNDGTVRGWMPQSFIDTITEAFVTLETSIIDGTYKPKEYTEEELYKRDCKLAIVDDYKIIFINQTDMKGYMYWYDHKKDNEPLTPTEYTTFVRWARGMDL